MPNVVKDFGELYRTIVNFETGQWIFTEKGQNAPPYQPFPQFVSNGNKVTTVALSGSIYVSDKANFDKITQKMKELFSGKVHPFKVPFIDTKNHLVYRPQTRDMVATSDAIVYSDDRLSGMDTGRVFLVEGNQLPLTEAFVWHVRPISTYPDNFDDLSQDAFMESVVNSIILDDENFTNLDAGNYINFKLSENTYGAPLYENVNVDVYREDSSNGRSPARILSVYECDEIANLDGIFCLENLWRKQQGVFQPAENNLRRADFDEIKKFVQNAEGDGLSKCNRCKGELFGEIYGLVGPKKRLSESPFPVYLICAICGHLSGGIRELGYLYELILRITHPKTVAMRIEEMDRTNTWKKVHKELLLNTTRPLFIDHLQYDHDDDELPQKYRNRYLLGNGFVAVEYPYKLIFSEHINDPLFKGLKIVNLKIVGKLYSPKI